MSSYNYKLMVLPPSRNKLYHNTDLSKKDVL